MIRRTATFLGLAFALLISHRADAMVYILQKGYSIKDVRALIKAKRVLEDKVTVNGVKGDMEVFLSPLKLSDALIALKPALKDSQNVLGSGTVVIDVSDGKWIHRLLMLKAGTKSKVVLFQMKLPANAPLDDPDGAWPGDLPRPSGARIDRVIQLEKSGAAFCQFSKGGESSFVEGYDSALKADGWVPIVNGDAKGGSYLSKSKDYMLIFSVGKTDGKSYGSVFLRRIKSLPLE